MQTNTVTISVTQAREAVWALRQTTGPAQAEHQRIADWIEGQTKAAAPSACLSRFRGQPCTFPAGHGGNHSFTP
jgi:hypothetical protein